MEELNRCRVELALLQASGKGVGPQAAEVMDRLAVALLEVLTRRVRCQPLLSAMPDERREDLIQEVYLVLHERFQLGECLLLTQTFLDHRLLDARRALYRSTWRLKLTPIEPDHLETLASETEAVSDLPAPICLEKSLLQAIETIHGGDPHFTVPSVEVLKCWLADLTDGHTPRGFPTRHPQLFVAGLSQPTQSRAICDLLGTFYLALQRVMPALPELDPEDPVEIRQRLQNIVKLVHPKTSERKARQTNRTAPISLVRMLGRDALLRRLLTLHRTGQDRAAVARGLARLAENASGECLQAAHQQLDAALDVLVGRIRDRYLAQR